MRVKGTASTVLVVDPATTGVSTRVRCGPRLTEEPRDKAEFSRDRQQRTLIPKETWNEHNSIVQYEALKMMHWFLIRFTMLEASTVMTARHHSREQGSLPKDSKTANRAEK